MTAPRLEIHLDRIHHNATTLVGRLASHGVSVTGVAGRSELANLNYGVGAMYDLNPKNAIGVDYTRKSYDHTAATTTS